jgi:hypothetical protein
MRYTIDMSTEPEKFNVFDTFTGKAVKGAENLDAESAQSRQERMNTEFDEAHHLVDLLTRFVNRSGSAKEFVANMACEHRTLQQGFTRLVVEWIEHLSTLDGPGNYDMRNAASVMLAKQIVATPGWERVKYLPLI